MFAERRDLKVIDMCEMILHMYASIEDHRFGAE